MRVIILDFETYWTDLYSLSKISATDYIRSPEFYAQCMSYSIDGLAVQIVEHEQIPATLKELDLTRADTITVGHNINGFDGLILSEIYNIKPACLLDTMAMSNWTGVSRVIPRNTLKELANYLKIGVKEQGTLVSKGKKLATDFTPKDWEYFKTYCKQDTQLTAIACGLMSSYLTADAIKFANITARMAIDPAFVINPEPLNKFLEQLKIEEEETAAEIEKMFELPANKTFKEVLRSDASFATMLQSLGVNPPMKLSERKTETLKKKLLAESKSTEDCAVYSYAFSKQDLEFTDLLEHSDPKVRYLVQARLSHKTSVPWTRTKALLNLAQYNKPVPIYLKAYYAHTSRYGAGNAGVSDGNNFQNLSKRDKKLRPLRQAVTVPDGYRVVAADSSQIECRVLGYAAQQLDLLEHFKEHRDPYAELAAQFGYGFTAQQIHDGAKSGDTQLKMYRNAAKRMILSGGYGVGHVKLAHTLINDGVILDPDREQHNALAKQFHAVYRKQNVQIVQFWKTCDLVIADLIGHREGQFGGPNHDLFKYGWMPIVNGESVASVKLPTGFILRYPNLRLTESESKLVAVYDKYVGGKLVQNKIYGGSMAENLIQSLAFQILMWQACRMYEADIELKANIHDSFATVVPEAEAEDTLNKMLKIMKTVPYFVEGCPLDAEGEIGFDFSIV